MPEVNFYVDDGSYLGRINGHIDTIKKYLAEELSCSDRKLEAHEITVRSFKIDGGDMIAPIELSIKAHHYSERLESSDKLAANIAQRIKDILSVKKVEAWLQLSEVGHSFS
jgi:hypothetical protein